MPLWSYLITAGSSVITTEHQCTPCHAKEPIKLILNINLN